ncbi:S41 family peptidase [Brevundimonas sp. BR2-1]|uniref:S41 family peptidase n=1 Tax=Brevundimonas sp. BR2-1 TaxID=3031123 RepID=UPI0030A0B3FF
MTEIGRRVAGMAAAMMLACAPVAASGQETGPEAVLSAEEARTELDLLYAGLEQAHYDLFAHRPRADYDRLHARMRGEINGPMTRQTAAILFQAFAAYGRVGHARVDAPIQGFVSHIQHGGRILPVFIRVDEGRVMLTEAADAEGRFPAGTEVLALNGDPVAVWLERLGAWVSAERPSMAHAQMEESFPALLWFALPEADGIDITGRGADGAMIQGRARAVTIAELGALRKTWPTPSLSADFSAREFRLLGDGIAYLRPGPFQEPEAAAETGAFLAFVDDAFGRLIEAGTTDLVLDLRNNPGGDNSLSDPMIAWFADEPFRFASSFTLRASVQAKAWYQARDGMAAGGILGRLAAAEAVQPNGARYPFELEMNAPRPEPRFHGRVHVLVNRHSYSNAASAAALIQDYDFGEIWGEETADVPTTYASVIGFELPVTGFTVTFPKSRIVRPSGDERLIGVIPDRPLPREPIGVAEDLVLAQALVAIRSTRSRP